MECRPYGHSQQGEDSENGPRVVFIGCNKWPRGEVTEGGTSPGNYVRGQTGRIR